MADINILKITHDSVTCNIINLDTSYTEPGRTVDWMHKLVSQQIGGIIEDPPPTTLGAGVSSGGTKTITGLAPATAYRIHATIHYNGGSKGLMVEFTTLDAPALPRPANWQWESIVQPNEIINISANEWVRFCKRINNFRAYKKLAEYRFIVPVSGQTPFHAVIVNEAKEAIEPCAPQIFVPLVSAGDTITASSFNTLKNSLNSIP